MPNADLLPPRGRRTPVGLRALSAALVAFALYGSPAQAIDDFFPTFGNLGIDVRHYAIRLDIDPSSNQVIGRAVLTVQATKSLEGFSLDLSGLNVQQVEIDGVAARYRHTANKLEIRPVAALAKGKRFKVAVNYRGVPKPIPDPTTDDPSSIPGLGWTGFEDSSYVVSEPVGAGTWYPVNDVPTDKATYRFAVTVDKPYTAVANGVPIAVTDLGQRRRFAWEQAQPMASYLAIVDVDRYRLQQLRSASGVPIRNFLTEATPAASRAALNKTPAMMRFIENYVGKYPFDGYGAVMVDDPELYYALETQAMSTFQSENVDELTVVHELAHQWFGNAVTVAQWRDLWLAEGFATYFEFLWQHRGDRAALDADFEALHAFAVREGIGPAVVSRPEDLFAFNTYYRGALTLQALRLDVGDRKFERIVRTFYRTYRNGNATSADFIRVAAEIGGAGVRRLLHAWLYEEPVPPLPGASSAAAQTLALKTGPLAPPALGIGVRRPHAP